MNNITLEEIARKISENNSAVILCHTNPDEDTVCSAYALYLAIKSLGKSCELVCDKALSERVGKYVDSSLFSVDAETEGKLVISVDIASKNMLGGISDRFSSLVDIRIDHHKISEEFGKYNYCDDTASACGMIIYELIKLLIGSLNKEMATLLYTAIASDTGGFRYSNTTADTHRTAASLIESGADAQDVSETLFETKTRSSFVALGLALTKLKYLCGGTVALISITNDEKKKNSLTDADLSELASISRQPEGVELGIVMKQQDNSPEHFKVSMRSREAVDSAAICANFGGGGHSRAAGATITAESPQIAEEMLLSEVIAHLNSTKE